MRIAVSRAPGAERVVTPLELFFDLVYVFAIGQLSHHLLEHVDLRTGAETAIMTLAVFYAWYMVAWGANWLDPDRPPVRLLLVGLMFASLLMSAAIPDAFDGRAWLFVTGYLLIQIGRSLFLIIALRGRALGRHFVNDLVWELGAGALDGAPELESPTPRVPLSLRRSSSAERAGGRRHLDTGVRHVPALALPGRGIDTSPLRSSTSPTATATSTHRLGLVAIESIAGVSVPVCPLRSSLRAAETVLVHARGQTVTPAGLRRVRGSRGRRRHPLPQRSCNGSIPGDRLRQDGCAVVVLLPAHRAESASRRRRPPMTPAPSAGRALGR